MHDGPAPWMGTGPIAFQCAQGREPCSDQKSMLTEMC